ncbi:MAG: restriction endonuclease subunit S, partial [Tabrizicola sp.]
MYSRRGDVERRSLVRSENDGWLCGTGCLRVRFGKRHVFPEYAAQYLGHPAVREWIVQHAVGATMPNLNTGILSAVPFVLPPMAVQVDIATVLSALDDKIELNRRMNETLEAMAQAIFRDWFVDFGPVRRKLAGVTDPAEIMGGLTPNPGRAAELAVLFPNQLNEHDLPSGWRCGAARDLLEFNPREQLRAGTPAPYSDMSSLPTRGTVAEPPITRPFGSGMRFRNGDALLARITPCLENGKGAWVDFLTDDAPVGWG